MKCSRSGPTDRFMERTACRDALRVLVRPVAGSSSYPCTRSLLRYTLVSVAMPFRIPTSAPALMRSRPKHVVLLCADPRAGEVARAAPRG